MGRSDQVAADLLDGAVLGYLVCRHPATVHAGELAQLFLDEDCRRALGIDGLLPEGGDLLCASRAAVGAAQIIP